MSYAWDTKHGTDTMDALINASKALSEMNERFEKLVEIQKESLKVQAETAEFLKTIVSAAYRQESNIKTYIVCIDRSFIRDAQVYTKENANETNLFTEENEIGWQDLNMHGFVGLFRAASAEKAKMTASVMHHYPTDILWAEEINKRVAL